MSIKTNKDKYIKHLESKLMGQRQAVKAYKAKYNQTLLENEQLRDELSRLNKQKEITE